MNDQRQKLNLPTIGIRRYVRTKAHNFLDQINLNETCICNTFTQCEKMCTEKLKSWIFYLEAKQKTTVCKKQNTKTAYFQQT